MWIAGSWTSGAWISGGWIGADVVDAEPGDSTTNIAAVAAVILLEMSDE